MHNLALNRERMVILAIDTNGRKRIPERKSDQRSIGGLISRLARLGGPLA